MRVAFHVPRASYLLPGPSGDRVQVPCLIDERRGQTGLLAKDFEECQAHLQALATDRARCQAMGHAGCEYVAEFHSRATRITQLEAMLLGAM